MGYFFEHIKRSVAKSISFRIIIIFADIIVIFILTHKYVVTAEVVIATNVVSTILYYTHERVWNRIHWGKSK